MSTDLIARLRELSRRGYWPLIGDEAADALEQQAAELARLRADAERWRAFRAMVRGERKQGSARPAEFAFPSVMELPPLGDIMRGSVAQHFDAAIDTARTRPTARPA